MYCTDEIPLAITGTGTVPTAGGFLTVQGVSFISPVETLINGQPAPSTYVSSSEIVIEINPGTGPNHAISISSGVEPCVRQASATWSYPLLTK